MVTEHRAEGDCAQPFGQLLHSLNPGLCLLSDIRFLVQK